MKKEDNTKNVNSLIIDEAVRQYKEGTITNYNDVENFLDNLLQPLLQKLLDTELENHLEYSRYTHSKNKANFRNGHCKPKTLKTKYGQIKLRTPRDRNATFNPVVVEKGQTRLAGFEDKCISLYAKGVSLRDIELLLKDLYGVNINKDDISRLISVVSKETEAWRNRKLKPMYVFTYADCIYVPIKDDVNSNKRAVYVIIGVDINGFKEILGMWIGDTESASFWNGIFEDLKERGVEDILFMSTDGIAGLDGSLERVFPKTQLQRCIVHLVRTIYGLCSRKDAKKIISDYKKIYESNSIEEAQIYLETFSKLYQDSNKKVVKKAEEYMQYIEPLFEIPKEIRKCIYTTNTVESVNSALRKVTNGKGAFPSKEAVYKILFLRMRDLSQKWTKPIPNWSKMHIQLSLLFGDRYTKYLDI